MASAGSFFSVYRIDLGQFTQDIASAKRQLTDLRAFAQQTLAGATGASPGGASSAGPAASQAAALRNLIGPQQQTADGALRLAQAEARLAVAMGQPARAATILGTALSQNVGASNQATLAVQTQAARLNSGANIFQQFGAAAKSSFLGILAPAALLTGALALLRSTVQGVEEGFKLQASLDASRTSIALLLRGVRDSNEVFAGAARFGQQYKLTQQEITEATLASIRVIRTSKAPIEDILGVFARMKVLAPEKTFSDAARALGELQAGQLVSLEKMFNVPLVEAHKMKVEIDGGADAVLVLSRYLDRSGVSMEAVAAQSKGAAGQLKDAALAGERLSLALGGGSGGAGSAILQARTNVTNALANALGNNANAAYAAAKAYDQAYTNAVYRGASADEAEAIAIEAKRKALARFIDLSAAVVAGEQAAVAASQAAAAAALQHAQGMEGERVAASQAGLAFQAHTQELRTSAEASVADKAAKDEEAATLALLTAQTQGAANAFIALNPNMSASAAAAAAAASGMSPLVVRLIEVTLRAQEARQALALFNALQGIGAQRNAPIADRAERDEFKHSNALRQRQESTAAAAASAEAERRLARVQGDEAPTIAHLRAEAEALKKTRGEASADYINKLSDIEEAEKRQEANAKKGRAGAGAAHLSDQAKLNNTLLADQAKADNKMADLEQDHYKNLLKIQADFEQKSLAQQRQNEVSKRQGRADFYDALTSSSKDLGQKESQALSAEYESAYAKAQGIAQAGNQKLADDYLSMRQQQIQKEIEYQKARAAAAKEGDKGEVARLDAIRKLQVEADAEKEKQLLAGGDPNVKARDEDLAQEGMRYDEAQGKIVTAADRTATAKVLAAQRSGKAIDEENLKLKTQADYYDRIRARTGAPASAGVAPEVATPTPGTGATPSGVPGAGDQLWRVFDSAVVDAINAQTERLSRDLTSVVTTMQDVGKRVSSVESAVRGLAGRALQ